MRSGKVKTAEKQTVKGRAELHFVLDSLVVSGFPCLSSPAKPLPAGLSRPSPCPVLSSGSDGG